MSDADLQHVVAAVTDAFERAQVPWLRQLVELPSHSAAREDVEAAARCLDQAMGDLGFSCETFSDPQGRYADHRVYSSPALSPSTPALALVGHVDTVFPRHMNFTRFERDVNEDGTPGDIIRGPGVLDMKSGLSVIVFGLCALKEVDPTVFQRLCVRVVVNTDEEVGSPSSRGVFATIAPVTTAALVFEAGRDEDRIITCRKGGGMFTLTAHGRAAHAGLAHHEGVNAIHALALVIPRVQALTDYDRGVTLNVGLIEGGTAKNTVPDTARCVIDARFITVSDADRIAEALQSIADTPFLPEDDVPPCLADARLTLERGIIRPPMEAHLKHQQLRQRYEAHASAVGLRVGEAPLQGGGSDANILAALGVPAIDGLGPWGKHFHKVEEWSSLQSLHLKTQALSRLLYESCGEGPNS